MNKIRLFEGKVKGKKCRYEEKVKQKGKLTES